MDITERKRAESKLRESEARFRALFDNSLDAIFLTVPEGIITAANPAACALFGMTEEELCRVGRQGVIDPNDVGHAAAVQQRAATGKMHCELSFIRKDGTRFSAEVSSVILAGEPQRSFVVVRDITLRKQAEEALRDSEQIFTSLANHIPQMVWMCTPDGLNVYFNQRWVDYTGMSLEESSGRGWNTPFHPEDKQAAWDAWNRAVQTNGEEPYRIESRLRAADGSYRWFLMRGEPLHTASGHVERWFGTCTDIHNLKLAHEQLMRSEKLAAVGRMAATISHEINNPLETVGQAIYLAANDPSCSTRAREYLAMASEELQRAVHVAKQTLDFSKESASISPLYLREIVEGSLKLFAARLTSRGIAVETKFYENGPTEMVEGEARQIITNLLSNSMDAVAKGGKMEVRLSRAVLPNGLLGVRLTVADQGAGMSPAQLSKIFEPFFTTKDVVGTGLGLWVVKQLVDKYKGYIRVRSNPGQGTVVSLVLPTTQTRAEQVQQL